MLKSKKNHAEPLSFRTKLVVFVTAYENLQDSNKPEGVDSNKWVSEAADLYEAGSLSDTEAFELIKSKFQKSIKSPGNNKFAKYASLFNIENDTLQLVTGYRLGDFFISYGLAKITVKSDYFSFILFINNEEDDEDERIVKFEARDKGTRNPDIRSIIDKDVKGWAFDNYQSVCRFFKFTDILLNRLFPHLEIMDELDTESNPDSEDFTSLNSWFESALIDLRYEARDAVLVNLSLHQDKIIDKLLLGQFMDDELIRFQKNAGR